MTVFIAAETRPTQTIRLVYILLVGQIHGSIYIFLTPTDAITTPSHFEHAWLIAAWGALLEAGEYGWACDASSPARWSPTASLKA